MPRTPSTTSTASRHDLRRILGELSDPKLIEILELNPTVADLEEATMCMAGDQDVLAKGGHPVSATAGRIVEILGEAEDEDRPQQAPPQA